MKIIKDCNIGVGTKVWNYVNLYGCTIGNGCTIGSYVEIGKGVIIGDNCKIEAGAFIPSGVIIGDNVFVGPHACFTNDRYPKATGEWTPETTFVCDGASIGANSTIRCGVTIGKNSTVGCGSVVTKDVEPDTIVVGNPAKYKEMVTE